MNWFRLGHAIPSGPRSISLGDSVGTSRKGTPTPLGLLAGEYTAGIARDHLCPPRGSAQEWNQPRGKQIGKALGDVLMTWLWHLNPSMPETYLWTSQSFESRNSLSSKKTKTNKQTLKIKTQFEQGFQAFTLKVIQCKQKASTPYQAGLTAPSSLSVCCSHSTYPLGQHWLFLSLPAQQSHPLWRSGQCCGLGCHWTSGAAHYALRLSWIPWHNFIFGPIKPLSCSIHSLVSIALSFSSSAQAAC